MNPLYTLRDASAILSPGLLFYKTLIQQNIARAIEMAGSPARLRPLLRPPVSMRPRAGRVWMRPPAICSVKRT